MNAADIATTLGNKGQTVTISGVASATYDPATSSTTPTAYTGSGNAVLLPLNPYKAEKNSDIIVGDERMLLSVPAAGKPPLKSTITLADGTTKYTLIAIDPLHPAGTELLYDCVVRGH